MSTLARCVGVVVRRGLSSSSSGPAAAPVKTALYDYHVEQAGKMVDFAGFMLPVVYSSDTITASHLHTRRHCSIFDVSHMLQTKIHGADRKELIERLTPADVRNLGENACALTVFTDSTTGGILDDLIVGNTSQQYLYVVSNAGRRDHDSSLLQAAAEAMKAEKKDVSLEFIEMSEVSLVAVQGPEAAAALQAICSAPISKMPFMSTTIATIGGIAECRVTRCGYTGEDGYEISVSNAAVEALVQKLTQSNQAQVKLAGLGARDSLRLEAGLCLYGQDITEKTTPVEASLSWLIPKTRRERQDFPGASVICRQLKEGVSRKRVGLKLGGGPPARHGAEISHNGRVVGEVTSGVPSPSLGVNIAMGYVSTACAKASDLLINVRGKPVNAAVAKMPFVPSKYYKV